MATASPKLPPKPSAAERFVMPDGTLSPVWDAYLKRLDEIVRVLRTEV